MTTEEYFEKAREAAVKDALEVLKRHGEDKEIVDDCVSYLESCDISREDIEEKNIAYYLYGDEYRTDDELVEAIYTLI